MNKKNLKFIKNEKIIWLYSEWKWNFWFIDVEWIDKWYYVYSNNKNWALDGDKVEAFLKVFRWKTEAEIIKVIERKQELIVWEYIISKWNKFWFVIPKNSNIKNDIFVLWKNSMNATNWDIVWVLVTVWKRKNPEWIIKKILWKKLDKWIDVLSIIIEAWVNIWFNKKLLNYINQIVKAKSNIWDLNSRKNLTKLFTYTIDWEDAKDLDDAISVEKLDSWDYKLYVHIADVSHYVEEDSILDKEAINRATSIYLVDKVIPMLPEKLSNDLCSLNPNTQKLTLTCEMIIWNNWKIKSQKIYESIIKSNYRLTYKQVDEILIWNKKDIEDELIKNLQIANELKEKITKYKNNMWVLNFDFSETKINLDNNWEPKSIEQYPKYDSNKLIEQFMISANQAVSFEFSKIPFLYRIHEKPVEDDISNLQDTLNIFWIKYIIKNADTKDFNKLLNLVWKLEHWKKIFLEKAILRTLSKAIYSNKNLGHFGLWLSYYSHFTSPIRRYSDLQIHRIIKEKINKKLNKKRIIHYKNILEDVAKKCSEKEIKAEKLEYKIKDYYIVKFYKNKMWQEFEWIINWVIPKWFFVQLKDTSEWFVLMEKSDYNEAFKIHIDLITWKKYRLWDSIKVKLIEVDEIMYKLNFQVI